MTTAAQKHDRRKANKAKTKRVHVDKFVDLAGRPSTKQLQRLAAHFENGEK